MSGKGGKRPAEAARVAKAVKLVLACEGVLSVPEAMRAAGFSGKCASQKSKQMWVHRRLRKARDAKERAAAGADASPLPITQPPEVLDSNIVGLETIPGGADDVPSLKSPPELLVANPPTSAAASSITTSSSRGTTNTTAAQAKALGLEAIRLTASGK